MHNDALINNEAKKYEGIHFYNSTIEKLDTIDQKCGNYSSPEEHADGLWQFFFNFSILQL